MAQQELGLGIDLGTTISLASVVDSSGRPQVVTNRAGKHLIPSAVYFETNVMVGDAALDLGLLDPEGLAEAFKRDIGKHTSVAKFVAIRFHQKSLPHT